MITLSKRVLGIVFLTGLGEGGKGKDVFLSITEVNPLQSALFDRASTTPGHDLSKSMVRGTGWLGWSSSPCP